MRALSRVSFCCLVGIAACQSSAVPSTTPSPATSATSSTPTPGATLPDGGPFVGGDPSACGGAKASTFTPAAGLGAAAAVTLAGGFAIELIARVSAARHIVALPNGDLLVGSTRDTVTIVPGADSDGMPGAPEAFAKLPESNAHGVAFAASTCTVYMATPRGIFATPYADAQKKAGALTKVASVRPAGATGHVTTSVAFANGQLYASVGSSCNACVETDPTRATVQVMGPDGAGMQTRAKRIRNAIALAVHPETGALWAGGAGQDSLPANHPYEFFDPVTSHPGVADYGWPDCEENQKDYGSGKDCSGTVVPRIAIPAYATILGATFYPAAQTGKYAFPASHKGGLFLSLHGSWHEAGGKYVAPPRVVHVAMNGETPKTPVDWNDPTKQWTEFVGGYQEADGMSRIGRPSGLAVGPQGSLFVADDDAGVVYRIRPK